MAQHVTDQLKHIIATELDVNLKLAEIDETESLLEGGIGLDSIAIMEFISLIEERFGFRFSDSELSVERFKNLKVLSEFISTKIKESRLDQTEAGI